MQWVRSLQGHGDHQQRVPLYSREHECAVAGRLMLLMHRMARGASPLLPPEAAECDLPQLARDAVESSQYSMVHDRLRATAA